MKTQRQSALKKYPLFFFLLPVFFVFHGCVENYDFVPLKDALLLTFIYISFTILLLLVFYFIYKNWQKAALMAFLLMSFHFFFGSLHDTLRKVFPGSFISGYSFVIPFSLCVLLLLFLYIIKRRRPFGKLVYFLNILFALIILIDIGSLVSKMTVKRKTWSASLSKEFTPCPRCPAPDIYFIVADEYAGNTELKEILNFDNGEFLSQLHKRSFRVLEHSSSNYNYTPYSIASTLDMDYLDLERTGKKPLLAYTYETIKNNRLFYFLRQYNYRLYNYTSFDFPGQPAETTETFLPSKTRLITGQTFLSRVEKEIGYHLITTLKWKKEIRKNVYLTRKNNELFYKLTVNAADEKTKHPKLVLAHFMMPHYPYYYDKNGREFPFEQVIEGNQDNQQNFIEYLQYSNKKFLELIDHILKNSPTPPLIILMGDHGFRHFNKRVDRKYYFCNLISVHLPDKNHAAFTDSLTNVNLLRVILNTTFGQRLSYLKDTSIIMDNP